MEHKTFSSLYILKDSKRFQTNDLSLMGVSKMALPLILQCLTSSMMLCFDRLILAYYDTTAMNAAALAGMSASVFQLALMGVASVSEIFVGQHNGSKRYHDIGILIWQMIWFSLIVNVIFLPVALYGNEFIIPAAYSPDGDIYFKWLMLFVGLWPLSTALFSYYAGRGRVLYATMVVVFSNILNCCLDVFLVFGIGGYFEPLGAEGAAISTVISMSIQVLGLFIGFYSKKQNQQYATRNYPLSMPVFKNCLKFGLPISIGQMVETAAWSAMMYLVALVSPEHLTAMNIGSSIHLLLAFTNDGMYKTVIVLSSNLIGGRRAHLISKLLKSSALFSIIVSATFFIPLVIYPEYIVQYFIANDSTITATPEYVEELTWVCYWVWVYLCVDSCVWVFAGVLTGSADTRFVMLMGAFNAWAFAILPMYVLVYVLHYSMSVTWAILCMYSFANLISFYQRYQKRPWGVRYSIPNSPLFSKT